MSRDDPVVDVDFGIFNYRIIICSISPEILNIREDMLVGLKKARDTKRSEQTACPPVKRTPSQNFWS